MKRSEKITEKTPVRNIPSNVPAPPMLTIPLPIFSMAFRWRMSAPTKADKTPDENASMSLIHN